MTSHQKITLGLAGLWLAVQVGMLALFGIGHGGDTGRYLGAADGFLHGELPAGKSASYLGYDLFVTLFMATPLGEAGVVAGQLIFSALAAVYMYKLGQTLFSPVSGYVASLFYIGFLKLHPWNVYILTDSLFISFLIISTYRLLTAQTKKQTAVATILILFTASLRPDGIAVLVAALFFAFYKLYSRQNYILLTSMITLAILAVPALWYAIGKTATDEALIEHYELGAIIWSYEPLYQTMPGSVPDYVHNIENPLTALFAFIATKPLYFAHIAAIKVWYEIIHLRPFHAPLHNFLIIVTLVPLYLLAMVGARHLLTTEATLLFGSLVALKMGIVAFTFADWTGRFLLHVMPIILLLAAAGLVSLLPNSLTKRYGFLH